MMIKSITVTRRLLGIVAVVIFAGIGGWAYGSGGGEVMPGSARPLGYSLTKAAAATAAFNVGPRTPDTLPDVPFQTLYVPNAPPFPTENTFTVKTGTHFYVPVFVVDDSPPVIGDFPDDVTDRDADADYMFDPDELGASLEIEVDGKVTELDASYVVGTTTDPLPDGGGTHYIAAGVFLNPMWKGTHTVKVRGLIAGAAWQALAGGPTAFELTYTVVVK